MTQTEAFNKRDPVKLYREQSSGLFVCKTNGDIVKQYPEVQAMRKQRECSDLRQLQTCMQALEYECPPPI